MIVVSLLLILVAVTLLVMGLAGGSSTLLISSIVASLLAAVALVIGARQAATLRRRPKDPVFTGSPATRLAAAPPARRGARRRDTPAFGTDLPAEAAAGRGDAPSDFSGSDPILADDQHFRDAAPDSAEADPDLADGRRSPDAEPGFADGRRSSDVEPDFGDDQRSPGAESGSAGDRRFVDAEPDFGDDQRSSGAESGPADDRRFVDAESELADGRSVPSSESDFAGGDRLSGADPRDSQRVSGAAAAGRGTDGRSADDDSIFDGDFADDDAARATSEADAYAAGRHDADAGLPSEPAVEHDQSTGGADRDGRRQEAGFDGDSTVIGATGTPQDDQPWRRDSHAETSSADLYSGASAADEGPPSDHPEMSGRSAPPDFPGRGSRSDLSDGPDPRESSAADEAFGEPDEDDPADEPPPQAVRPGDAVRVARMDAEVLVVDGRPRYHLGDCPSLAGRRTEPLPASEVVELGFSPCGQCRPVDRLVAQAARR